MLDREVANKEWIEAHKEINVETLVARSSNQRPILLSCSHTYGTKSCGGKNFKYEAWWATEIDCEKVVREGWKKANFGRGPFKKLKRSINGCTWALKRWNSNLWTNKVKEINEKSKALKLL